MGKKVEHPLDILREELQQTNVALKCAYDKFNYVTEPELIEASIYEISALKADTAICCGASRSRSRRPAPGDGRRCPPPWRPPPGREDLYVRYRDRRTVRGGGVFTVRRRAPVPGGR